jgi:hypothetical protein
VRLRAIERDRRLIDGGGDQRAHRRLGQRPGAVAQHHAAHLLAGADQPPVGIGQRRAAQEEQGHPARVERDRQDGVRGLLARPVADHQRVVVVIDQLERSRQELAQGGPGGPRLGGDLRTEAIEEAGKPGFG